mmetsp:Transcript_5699/g.16963  ORF Transcript_5699/g.16963 Transcript_5699/m.16963 type:complete len:236 (-) Transcript_5699:96-803(-)
MFRQPALLSAHVRGNTQREALLAKEGVATVPGSVREDRRLLRKVADVFVLGITGPWYVLSSVAQGVAHRVQAGQEVQLLAQLVQHLLAHTCHDVHVDHDVCRVRDLDADLRYGRTDRSHAEGHDVHCPSLHAALEETVQFPLHDVGIFPVVCSSGILLFLRTDIGALLHPRHIPWVRPSKERIGPKLAVQPHKRPTVHQALTQSIVLLASAIAEHHIFWLAQIPHLSNPGDYPVV